MATAFTARPVSTFSAVRHQPVALKTAAVRRRHIRHLASLIGMGVVLALVFVWVRIQVIQLGYEVSRLRKETSELVEQKNRLTAEVEALKAPARIEAVARERFGMRLPMGEETILSQAAGVAGAKKKKDGDIPAPAAPAPGAGEEHDAQIPDR